MAKHMVTCRICKERFDTNAIPAVKIGNRAYAHQTCSPDKGEPIPMIVKEKTELDELKEYIYDLLGDSCNHALVTRQLKKFINENNYTCSGILKSLKYFYEVQGNSIDKSMGGIGIVPYCYENAKNYYFNMWLSQQKNLDKNLEGYKVNNVTLNVSLQKREPKKIKLFSSIDEDIMEDYDEQK